MKNYIHKLLSLVAIAAFLASCEPEIQVPVPSSGAADFSKYIAVGNSLTAGFADNGLYAESQQTSYPALISMQMNQVVSSDFVQPDIPGNGSGYAYVSSLDVTKTPPAVVFGEYPEDAAWLTQLTGPFNNLGVPGIRVKDITVMGYGASPTLGNPYFYRMLGGKAATTSYLQMVQESDPSFFTCWMGNNDVLGYATSGGVYGVAGLPVTGLNGLTNPDTEFKPSYDALVAALTADGAKGVLVTIPDITSIPFFTTVAWNALALDASTANLANQYYSAGIDTAIVTKVITLAVTEEAVKANVIPVVAQQAVYQQAYAQAIAGGATPQDAQTIANNYVASPEGQTAIAQTDAALDAELRNHLLGVHTAHTSLEPLYAVVDQQLATNTTLQQGIAVGIRDTKIAYKNNTLPPAQKALIDGAVNATITQLKAAGIYPVFNAGPNGFVIEVPVTQTNPLGIRQMKAGEYVLLTALIDGQLSTSLSNPTALLPKPNQYILTSDEVANVVNYTNSYNNIIRSYANADIAIFESDDVLEQVNQGLFMDGVSVDGSFLLGGAFSLDAVHLTPRGYSIVANEIIKTINAKFGSSVPPVNINNYRAVVLP